MDNQAGPRPKRPRRRRGRLVVLGILAVAILSGVLSWRYRVDLANQTAQLVMQALDIDSDISFRVAEVETGRLRLENLAIGENGPRAAAAEITFRPTEIVQGRLRDVRLIRPSLALDLNESGGFSVRGVEASGAEVDAELARDFPLLPDVDVMEIVDAEITIAIDGFDGVALGDGIVRRRPDGSHLANIDLHAATSDGRQASVAINEATLNYGPQKIAVTGPVSVTTSDVATAMTAQLAMHVDLAASADGGLALTTVLTDGKAEFGSEFGFDHVKGHVDARLSAAGEPSVLGLINLKNVRAPSTRFNLVAAEFDLKDGGIQIAIDGIGPTGYLNLDLDGADNTAPVGFGARGEIDATSLAAFVPDVEADGRLRIEAGGAVDMQAMMAAPALRHVTGAAKMTLEMPEVSIKDFAPEGAIRGSADLELAGGALTFTGRGISLSGVNLPDAILESLPAEVRGAFAEEAFVRLGGPGILDTVITISEGLNGGGAAVGRIGLGVSNPNLAIFLEGDAALALDAEGGLEFFESERLVVRLVDGAFGGANIGGRMELFGLSGQGETFTADASVEAFARFEGAGIVLEDVEFDLKGPFQLSPGEALLLPRPGGKIIVQGYSGPQLSADGPIELTLTAGGHSVAYDRSTDELAATLDFRGFQTVGALNADELGTGEVDLKLGGLGVVLDDSGVAIRLKDAAARFPAYDLVLGGANARIAFGGDAAQSGRLEIARIYHDVEAPTFAPLILRVGVEGRGDRLTFEGALLAANDQARLDVTGTHDLASGVGEARIVMPPIVFAPGVLQPQDFVPALYRNVLEAVGEIAAEADLAWNTDGLTQQDAVIDLSIDKLRSPEITIERVSTEFRLDAIFPPSSDGPQRVQVGELDIGVPLVAGALEIDVISPEKIDLSLEEFGLFGGVISSREATVNPAEESFELNLEVTGIDLASILAFAEFGELQATGELEGILPLKYDQGELRIDGGLLQTAGGGGVIRYKPAEIDKALSEVDRSSELALKAISNFEYDAFRIGINENDSEEIRLDIFMSGLSRDLFEGVPFEFNIVIEGPLRQIIQDNVNPIDLPEDVQEMLDEAEGIERPTLPAPDAGIDFETDFEFVDAPEA